MKNSTSAIDKGYVFPRNTLSRGYNSIPAYALVSNTAEQCRKMYQTTWSHPQPGKRVESTEYALDYAETMVLDPTEELALVCCFQRVMPGRIQRLVTEEVPQIELTQALQLYYMQSWKSLRSLTSGTSTFSPQNSETLIYETPEYKSLGFRCEARVINPSTMIVEMIIDGVVRKLPPVTQNMITYFDYKLSQIVSSWDEAKAFDKNNNPSRMIQKWREYATDVRAKAGG